MKCAGGRVSWLVCAQFNKWKLKPAFGRCMQNKKSSCHKQNNCTHRCICAMHEPRTFYRNITTISLISMQQNGLTTTFHLITLRYRFTHRESIHASVAMHMIFYWLHYYKWCWNRTNDDDERKIPFDTTEAKMKRMAGATLVACAKPISQPASQLMSIVFFDFNWLAVILYGVWRATQWNCCPKMQISKVIFVGSVLNVDRWNIFANEAHC